MKLHNMVVLTLLFSLCIHGVWKNETFFKHCAQYIKDFLRHDFTHAQFMKIVEMHDWKMKRAHSVTPFCSIIISEEFFSNCLYFYSRKKSNWWIFFFVRWKKKNRVLVFPLGLFCEKCSSSIFFILAVFLNQKIF